MAAEDVALVDLWVRTARELKVLEANEPLSAEDRQVFIDAYGPLYAMLEGRGLVQWAEDDPIPPRYFLPVRALLAEQTAREFGKDYSAPWALSELQRQVKPDYRYDETRFQDY